MSWSSSSSSPPATMAAAREHVERIRWERYFIGRGEKNPLSEDVHQAVNYLSQELYSKDVHFLMELVQNAEDNEYPDGVAPSLEFLITSKDITGIGASSTLILFNNEKGFSAANIESICRMGKSTKKGNRNCGYIGEKGIGFKSVFLISRQPHIFSNGYQIKFNEEPSAECDIGYIVPEWVESKPSLSDIQSLYGSSKALPATTIILPLKSEKVGAVKQQLSSLHPELLLFLAKIRQLSVREDNDDPKCSTVNEISISSETNFQLRKNIHAESYTLHLSAQESGKGEECGYYMWKQRFPVKPENRVDKRAEIDEWVITLAFPHGQRLSRGARSSPGVYAFLPTEMVTGFPFIIQADFLLASSREAILFDSPWNKGILECVPTAFLNAFVALVKSTADAPALSLPSMFHFLPVDESPIALLSPVRSGIRDKVLNEHIIPCETYGSQKMFCKPGEVCRLKPAFWVILRKALESGVDLKSLSSHGSYILSSHFDKSKYHSVLEFLGVKNVSPKWYGKCIKGSNLVKEASEDLYLDLLSFIANNWSSCFSGTDMQSIPLLRCIDKNGVLSYWSLSRATAGGVSLCIACEMNYISWLISWNREFSSSNLFFMPASTQSALEDFSGKRAVTDWLQTRAKMKVLSLYNYGSTVAGSLKDRRHAIAFAHFLFHSSKKGYISDYYLDDLCRAMPVVDKYGSVVRGRSSVLVPAKGSNWVGLMGTNPWQRNKYIELAADYMFSSCFAGNCTSEDQLSAFLKKRLQASDVPFIHPPDASLPTVLSPLTVDNAFLLLQWIRNLKSDRVQLPRRFLACIRGGSWMMTSIGYKPPRESFLSSAAWGSLLQVGSDFVDIPMVSQEFYRNQLHLYSEELKTIGVRFEFGEASSYIGKRLMSIAASNTLTRENVYSLLRLIRCLREKLLSPSDVINSVKNGSWLKTTLGYMSPVGSIVYESEWAAASLISCLPFIDVSFYGEDILQYKPELELLGVCVGFKNNYKIVADNFKFSSSTITSEATLLILKCIRHASSCDDFIRKLKGLKWLKTTVGFCAPSECFIVDLEWECLVKIFDGIPVIDFGFYGNEISLYKEELERTGLIARFEEASKAIAHRFKQMVSTSSLTKANVLALAQAYRLLRSRTSVPVELVNCMRCEKWLHTSLGFRSPSDAILFDAAWQPLTPIASLPFIDDSDSASGLGKEIYGYKDELEHLGVTVEAKNGARFVIKGLNIPNDHSVMTAATVLSLLGCIRRWMGSTTELSKDLLNKIRKKWLKTTLGFQYPEECMLFDLQWSSLICVGDGPFIDQQFYGEDIMKFKDVLATIGVTVDVKFGCDLVGKHLKYHTDGATISRIYMYLKECNWKPEESAHECIWIPSGSESGEWVSSVSCVLHDRDNLFGVQLHVLDKYYDGELLDFFLLVLRVRHGPNAEDYCKRWSTWESSVSELTVADCSAFWEFIANNWSKSTAKLLCGCVTKAPVYTDGKIILLKKEDVFIPDDLLLKDLFDELPHESLFIWYPSSSLPALSRTRLNSIYSSIGVQTISESVQKNESLVPGDRGFRTVDAGSTVIKPGLLQIVLSFLANPALDIPAEERHQMVSNLVNVTVLERDEPITVGYSVALSSGRAVDVKASRMLRWERENSKLYIQRSNGTAGYKEKIEFATYFAREISQGLLFERDDKIPELAELVKVGCLLEFQDAVVEFLLKSKNLQLFAADEALLHAALPLSLEVTNGNKSS